MIAAAILAPLFTDILLPVIRSALAAPPPADPQAAERSAEQTATAVASEVAGAVQANMQLLAADAASADLFRSGWRPAFGWITAAGAAYEVLARPLLSWGAAIAALPAPPALPGEVLWPMVAGLLGIAGLRTVEKARGVDGGAAAAVTAVVKGVAAAARGKR